MPVSERGEKERLKNKGILLEREFRAVAGPNQQEGVLFPVLGNGRRFFLLLMSRRIFSRIAVRKMGYCGADVARILGINTSAVNRLAVSDELPEIGKYI